MKKTFTLLFALMSFVSMYAQTLLETKFETEEDFAKWTVIDNNSDDKTWSFDSLGDPAHVFYSYSGANAADDWLISPAIEATQDGTVAVMFTVKGSSYTEKMEVMYGNAPTVETMVNRGTEVTAYLDNICGEYFLMSVKAGETYYLGFHAVSDADKWRLYLCDVTAKFVENPVDLTVSEIVSPIEGEGLSQETVTVKVKNEGLADASEFNVGFSVDGDTVAVETLNQNVAAGAEIEYTFTAKADLSSPHKKYTIKAWTECADDVNPANDARVKSVLHVAPATVPYYMGFEASENTGGIKMFNLNEDSGNWDVYADPWWNMARTGDYCLAYNYDKDNNGDDWAILDPIEIKEAGYYVLKFWYSTDNTHPESFAVYYGAEQKVESMTNQIVDFKKVACSEYKESISIIYIDEPQILCLGFHSYTDKDENWICVDDLSFEKIDADNVDLAMVSISNPGDYVRSQSKKEISFSLRSLAIKDVTAKVKVMIDENVISETTENIAAQEIKQFVLADKLIGITEGRHTLKAVVSTEEDKNTANDTVKLDFYMLGDAVVMWDFEDGEIPAEFKFKTEDSGTVNPSAGSEFNEYGWGLFVIQEHTQYGNYMFAGTSWLDGTDKADRWCVLPEIKVTSEESFLVWDAASFNAYFLEDYSVMISSNGDDSWYYFTELEVVAESPEFKTRGLNLKEYVDKNVFIAFRLRSKNCDVLVMDNIGLYGGVQLVNGSTSVEDTLGDSKLNVVLEDDCIKANKAVDSMMLMDMSGKVVAQTTGSELVVSNASPGVYVVKAVAGTEILSKKIVIK